jgi:peptidoglycan hydrolase CwlO-like protein
MARRTAVLAALGAGLLAAAPAAGDNSAKIAALHAKVAAARQKEAALTVQLSSITSRIRTLEGRVGDVSRRLTVLERDLALHRERLAKLNALFAVESDRLHFLRRQYRQSVAVLNRRLVQIYEEPNPTVADVILSAKSVQDAIDTLHYLTSIAQFDNDIATCTWRGRGRSRSAPWSRRRRRSLRFGRSSNVR